MDNRSLIAFIITAVGMQLCVSSCDQGGKNAGEASVPAAVAAQAPAAQGATSGQTGKPPVITVMKLLPLSPRKADELFVEVTADGPPETAVDYSYQWSVNGNPLILETRQTLKGAFVKGDKVSVELTPEAAGLRGAPAIRSVTIGNTPPTVQNELADLVVKGNSYSCRVQAMDPDGDPLVYTLLKGPKSMAVDRSTGMITGEYLEADAGMQTLSVSVKDPGNAEAVLTIPFQLGFSK